MKLYLKTRDFSVTGEEFQLLLDDELELLVTRPQPENLEVYYRSENYISHTDSKKTLIDKVYQLVKRFSLWSKVRLIHKFDTGSKTLLDFGAGTGDFLLKAKKSGWSVTGVEPNQTARMRSREKRMELCSNIQELEGSKYNVITLWHVLEHLPDLERQIDVLLNFLEVDGTLVVAVPNYRSFDASFYGEFWAAFDTPRHLWHFSRSSMGKIFARHSMKVVKTKPMWFDAFYVSLLSEKYKYGRQRFLPAFFVGLISNIRALVNSEFSSVIYILRRNGHEGRKSQ